MNPKDKEILRTLARRVAEIAAHPGQAERARLWQAHNDLQPVRPLVFVSPEGGWSELIPADTLQCEDTTLRGWEQSLRMRIYAWEHFADDQVTDAVFNVGYAVTHTGWGLSPHYLYSGMNKGAYRWDPPLKDPKDLDKLHFPEVKVDHEATQRNLALAQEIFGDILEVRLVGRFWWTLGLIGELSLLRGLEQVYWDLYDNPDFIHRAMRFLMEGKLRWLDSLEAQGLLSTNAGNCYVGSGGFGFTNELPASSEGTRTQAMWGFAESQEITGVSPAMHEEFVLQYQIPILERFGLNCYGCCEPLHQRFDLIKKVPRLRRVSVSPFCDRKIAAEALQDKYVYSWKPHPGDIAAFTFDPDHVRRYIRETLEITKGCVLEMILKDTHTCQNDPLRFDQWTQIAQEEIQRFVERG